MSDVTLDLMEYANDADAQAAYVSSGIGSELLENNGFETWTGGDNVAPDSWNLYSAGETATVAKESTIKHGGSYSAKVTRSGNDGELYQYEYENVPGIAGKRFTFSGWVYATVANRVRLKVTDASSNWYSSYHPGDSQWHFLTATGTMTLDYAGGSCVVDTGDTSGYFDDVSFKQTDLQSYSEDTIKNQGT